MLSGNLQDITWKFNIKKEIDININIKELNYEDAKWMSWLRIVTTSRIVVNT